MWRYKKVAVWRKKKKQFHTWSCSLASTYLASNCMKRVQFYLRKLTLLFTNRPTTPTWQLCVGRWFHMLSDKHSIWRRLLRMTDATQVSDKLYTVTLIPPLHKRPGSKFTCCQLLRANPRNSKLGPVPESGFSENTEYVNPEMRGNSSSSRNWEMTLTLGQLPLWLTL